MSPSDKGVGEVGIWLLSWAKTVGALIVICCVVGAIKWLFGGRPDLTMIIAIVALNQAFRK